MVDFISPETETSIWYFWGMKNPLAWPKRKLLMPNIDHLACLHAAAVDRALAAAA